ncbi:hypothetical protein TrVGV298_011717 [Trichoderma virens]|nr:hypothetical protein TrVGV298_011717 [Trichoderma virens]
MDMVVSPVTAAVFLLLLLVDVAIVGLLLYSLEPLITLLRRNDEVFSPRITIPRNDPWSSSPFSDDDDDDDQRLSQTAAV